MRILLVEDDEDVARAIEAELLAQDHAVVRAADGRTALTSARTGHWDLILLDLGLPGVDGMRVLRTIREEANKTPVIIITARDALESRLGGLDAGADDYLIKPFHMVELFARMRAVMRRHVDATPNPTNGVVTLHRETREATVREGDPIRLTKREAALLDALLQKPGAILSTRNLITRLYPDEDPSDGAVGYIVHCVRRKLGEDVIENVRGLGWRVAPVKAPETSA